MHVYIYIIRPYLIEQSVFRGSSHQMHRAVTMVTGDALGVQAPLLAQLHHMSLAGASP